MRHLNERASKDSKRSVQEKNNGIFTHSSGSSRYGCAMRFCSTRVACLLAPIGLFLLLVMPTSPLMAAAVLTEVRGVDGAMRDNVRASLSLVQAEDLPEISVWRIRQMAEAAADEIQQALQPFGYYRVNVSVRLEEPTEATDHWHALIEIEPGEPVRVGVLNVQVDGQADELGELFDWQRNWPLPEGSVLRHRIYEQSLREMDFLAEAYGFYQGRFVSRRIEVDPARNQAEIDVRYDAGTRYRIGQIDFSGAGFSDRLMQRMTIVQPGQLFHTRDIDRQREVLARSGYFEQINIERTRDDENHEVDLSYQLVKRPPNTYRVLAGFGTDTGARLQLGWTRHYLSDRGDRLDMRFGAQQTDSEFIFRTQYEHPFGRRPMNFFNSELFLRRERERFSFQDQNRIESVFDSFSGTREQAQLTVGRNREYDLGKNGFEPLQERLFVTYLNERFDAFSEQSLNAEQTVLLEQNRGLRDFLDVDTNTLALGGEWTLLRLEGENFATSGHFFQARVLAASETLGSDVSFLQGYLSGRWHWLFHPRHKLLVRGEVGYTEADTTQFNLAIAGDSRQLDFEITDLPELFRFQAGGDRSVRGYAFEELSTNRNGANHILVGSVEYEFNFYRDFSVAAFYDIGNAFNDFADPELKRGVGLGLRWYTLIGPVQLDIANALDEEGNAFRIHFTIGTRLL